MVSLQAALVSALLTVSAPGETVLLDFTASWCGPCQQMAPVVNQLMLQGAPIRKVDIDRERELAARYKVTGVPCFVMVVDGREVDREVGATTPQRLQQMLAAARQTEPSEPANVTFRGQSPDNQAQSPLRPQSLPGIRSEPPLSAAIVKAAATPSKPQPATGPLAEKLIASSVRLRINDGDGHSVGSGTIIDSRAGEALIVTCGHVFRDSQGKGQITVDLFGPGATQGIPGKLVSYDLESDVGLVSIRPGRPVTAARLAKPNYRAKENDPVINIGCDHGADATAHVSRINGINKFMGPPNVVVAGQPVQGRSGGGLFSAEGHVIGVCNAADPTDDQGLYAAIDSIYAELTELGLTAMIVAGVETADLAAVAPPAMPERMPAPAQVPPQTVATAAREQATPSINQLSTLHETAEVICIVRPRSNPTGKSQVIVLDQASPALLEHLQAAGLGR